VRRENLILFSFIIPRFPSSTALKDEILTQESTNPDDELKSHPPQWGNLLDGIFRIDPHVALQH
jgi:hypothetical protein